METHLQPVFSSPRLKNLTTAMFEQGFPCNPIPFAQGLADYVRDSKRSDSIQDEDAQKMLYVLMVQSYGQLAVIDLIDEWQRLHKLFVEKTNGD